ncbi:sodium:proton antiporter [Desulfoluna limicola]|uniref:Sodium:proton antiporter n=1 Tax=Desulfoluna limicola TaxID=2810562 RepID=A0ABM7PE25_9BACT|nr:Na+/H+ antiporter NhaC family protein [Desulfoluna limicola]BCS95333.1 sodium:proton antiporter [Desulfoluna limicola]
MNRNISTQPHLSALLPLGLFLAIFVGSGLYFQSQGTSFAFYQVAAPVAALPAIILSILLSRQNLTETVERFLTGAGHSNIMAMCMIYLLAGGFSAVAKATGGVDSVVAVAISIIPASFLLPGLFVVGALISTAMGTSMGTIAALAPIAVGVAGEAGLPMALTAGAVTSGAMFGDNLSIISDTTIAATRTQGCEMKDKFRVNVAVAVPAAILTIVVLLFQAKGTSVAEAKDASMLLALPYAAILIMAVSGLNVFAVLLSGIVLAGIAGFIVTPDFTILTLAKETYTGFTGMQEIFILSIFIGGLGELMKAQGGLLALERLVSNGIRRVASSKGGTAIAEAGIGALVFLTNLCTANNTVSILVTGGVAKNIAEANGVEPKRAAGTLDIFACICQGLIPWGAQILLVASIFKISPLAVVSNVHYCMVLFVCAVVGLFVPRQKVKHI